MSRRLPAVLAATLAATVALAAAAAGARGAPVEVRVDTAAGAVLFDGTVETEPHAVDGGDGSGPHPCVGAGAAPAPTATGALDDAMRGAGVSWHGAWDPSFRDFFVDRIGPYSSTPSQFWSLTVDGRFSSGGCLATVAGGDLVHFQFGSPFGEPGAPAAPGGSPTAPGGRGGGGAQPPPFPAATGPRPRALAAAAAGFLRRHRGGAGAGWGRLALALRRGRGSEAAAAALLDERLARQRRDGSIAGEVDATAVAVLALGATAPARAAAAARWLAGAQGEGGGFGFRPGAIADVDSTALAGWALARAGHGGGARRAAAFLVAAENGDGGFPSLPGGESNAQSTGLALVALRVGGSGPRLAATPGGATPLDYLASLARPDGSLEYSPGSRPTPAWTTAQALLGLTGRGRLLARFGPGAREKRRARASNTLHAPYFPETSLLPTEAATAWRPRA